VPFEALLYAVHEFLRLSLAIFVSMSRFITLHSDVHLTLNFPTLEIEALESMCPDSLTEERKSCGLHMSRRGMGTEPGYLSSDLSS
jgi:hypothetical protein